MMWLLLALMLPLTATKEVRVCGELDALHTSPAAKHSGFVGINNTVTWVTPGQTAQLSCQVSPPYTHMAAWLLKSTRRLLVVGEERFTQDLRLSSRLDSGSNTWLLTIANVTHQDEDIYECQISKDPWLRLQAVLRIEDRHTNGVDDTNQDDSASQPKLLMTADYYQPGWLIDGSGLCQQSGRHTSVVAFIQSAPSNHAIRDALRRTWAAPVAGRRQLVMAFMIAAVQDQAQQRRIEHEAQLYGDIIQARFIDHYDNLTLKSLACLEWFSEFCPRARFLLKVDDDVFLNTHNLLAFAAAHSHDTRSIFGNVVHNPKPDRDVHSRYYASPLVWDKTRYPRYTGGPLYLISGDAVADIRRQVMRRPYFFIEDVTITGIAARLAGVQRRRAPEFFTYKVDSAETCLLRLLVGAHQIEADQMEGMWRRVHDPDIRCPVAYSPSIWQPCVSTKSQDNLRHCVLNLFSTKKQ